MALTKVDKSLLETTSGTPSASTFLRGDGTWDAPASSGFIKYTVYTASSSTWTKADNNPTKIVVEVQGAGGSGGGGGASKGAGGGGGGYVRKFFDATALAGITTCTVEVGSGGLNPTTNSAGNAGGASKFYQASGSGTPFTSLDGLGGAGGAANYGAGGLGGVSSGGDLTISGGSGGGNSNENNHGGGSFFTPSHYSVTSGLNPSGPGTGYGGGGEGSRVTGGGAGSKGGDGMDGIVIVWEYK